LTKDTFQIYYNVYTSSTEGNGMHNHHVAATFPAGRQVSIKNKA